MTHQKNKLLYEDGYFETWLYDYFLVIFGLRMCIANIRAVGVLRSLGKHQQSRDRTFLHQSCTQLFFSTPKKNFFFEIEKKI